MAHYIDGFIFPISKNHLQTYQKVSESIAEIWKEYGALAYKEYLADDMHLEGTLPFPDLLNMQTDETVIFGWVVFDSKETRDAIHKKISQDKRMLTLTEPLRTDNQLIFDAKRMAFGGFKPFVQVC